MSVDFYPAIVAPDGSVRPAIRCACDELDAVRPPIVKPLPMGCAACISRVNMSNVNAHDVLDWLGLDPSPTFDRGGTIEADKLAALCRTRLGMVNAEEDRPAVTRGRYTECGRSGDYLSRRTAELLVIATYARGGWVAWS